MTVPQDEGTREVGGIVGRAVPAVALAAVCWYLWLVLVAPTLGLRQAPTGIPGAELSLQGLPFRGVNTAPLGMIVFADFECPVCGTFAIQVLPELVRRYVAPGKVLLAFSDLPLEAIHPLALRRAVVAECAARQGRFWEVHDLFFTGLDTYSAEQGRIQGVDAAALKKCIAGDAQEAVRTRQAVAVGLGLTSTPTIALGSLEKGRLRVTDLLSGLQSIEALSETLDRRLQ
jgi:protein-disulfide isomerase